MHFPDISASITIFLVNPPLTDFYSFQCSKFLVMIALNITIIITKYITVIITLYTLPLSLHIIYRYLTVLKLEFTVGRIYR